MSSNVNYEPNDAAVRFIGRDRWVLGVGKLFSGGCCVSIESDSDLPRGVLWAFRGDAYQELIVHTARDKPHIESTYIVLFTASSVTCHPGQTQ